jgi:hypothetical protein
VTAPDRFPPTTLAVTSAMPYAEEQFELVGLNEAIGAGHFYPSVHAAVHAFDRSRAVPV